MLGPATVYIDTNIFVHHLYPTPGDPKEVEVVRRTTMFFQDVENQKYRAVTTTFTLTEYKGAMKRVLSDQQARIATDQEVDQAIQTVESFIRNMGIELFKADDLIKVGYSTLFADCDRIVEKSTPTLTTKGWKSIGGADGLLAALADRCAAQLVATLDSGFKGLKGGVSPLVLWDAY